MTIKQAKNSLKEIYKSDDNVVGIGVQLDNKSVEYIIFYVKTKPKPSPYPKQHEGYKVKVEVLKNVTYKYGI